MPQLALPRRVCELVFIRCPCGQCATPSRPSGLARIYVDPNLAGRPGTRTGGILRPLPGAGRALLTRSLPQRELRVSESAGQEPPHRPGCAPAGGAAAGPAGGPAQRPLPAFPELSFPGGYSLAGSLNARPGQWRCDPRPTGTAGLCYSLPVREPSAIRRGPPGPNVPWKWIPSAPVAAESAPKRGPFALSESPNKPTTENDKCAHQIYKIKQQETTKQQAQTQPSI